MDPAHRGDPARPSEPAPPPEPAFASEPAPSSEEPAPSSEEPAPSSEEPALSSAQGPSSGPAAASGPAPGLTWAGIPPRLAAAIVDRVILLVVWFAGLFLFVALLTSTGRIDASQFQQSDLLSGNLTSQELALAEFGAAIYYLISGFYHIYAWVRLRATPGQQALRLWVLDAQSGQPLGPGRAVVRWFVLDLPLVGILFGILMAVWYAFLALTISGDRYRRGLHDRAGRSVVVRHP